MLEPEHPPTGPTDLPPDGEHRYGGDLGAPTGDPHAADPDDDRGNDDEYEPL